MQIDIQKEHKDKIIEQFSKQALPFTKIKGHYNVQGNNWRKTYPYLMRLSHCRYA